MADDRVVLRIFQLDAGERRRREGREPGRERAVAERAAARPVFHLRRFGEAFGFGDIPGLGGGRDQHLSHRGPHLTEGIPVGWCAGAAAGVLLSVLGLIQIGLFDLDGLPVDFQFLGDQHRQRRLDALPDLRVLAHDRHRAVGADFHERLGDKVGRRRCALREQIAERVDIGSHEHAASGERGDLQKRATGQKHRIHPRLLTARPRGCPPPRFA